MNRDFSRQDYFPLSDKMDLITKAVFIKQWGVFHRKRSHSCMNGEVRFRYFSWKANTILCWVLLRLATLVGLSGVDEKLSICHCKVFFFIVWASYFNPLLGRTRSRNRCWAAIRLSHRPELSDRAVHEEVDGLDIEGRHGRRFVLLRHTHRLQRRPYSFVQAEAETSDTGAEVVSRTHAVLGKIIPEG